MSRACAFRCLFVVAFALGACKHDSRHDKSSASAAPGSTPRPRHAPAASDMRPATTLHLTGTGNHPGVDLAMPASRYIDGDTVHVQAGDTFSFTGDIRGAELVHMRRVEATPLAKDTITVTFAQADGMMKLAVDNGFSRPVKFHVTMQVPDRAEPLKTSLCPVRAAGSLYETWPHPIIAISLKAPKVLPAGGTAPCD